MDATRVSKPEPCGGKYRRHSCPFYFYIVINENKTVRQISSRNSKFLHYKNGLFSKVTM